MAEVKGGEQQPDAKRRTSAAAKGESERRVALRLQKDSDSEDLHFLKIRWWFSLIILWIVIFSSIYFTIRIFWIVLSSVEYTDMMVRFIFTKAPAVLGVPFSAALALAVVLMLRTTQGPVRFRALGLRFDGASGPIVMWVLCFLATSAAIKILWN